MTDEVREIPTPPAFGALILPDSGDPLDAPTPVAPYFRLYRQGPFLHKPMVFGHGIVPAPKPDAARRRLPEFVNEKGWFWFEGPKLSAKVITQAIHFFRRILDTKNTEAEVIVTQNQETGEHRLFVPLQSTSHGGVRSIYNPEHIAPNHLVIGTIHSHCNFGAYHSGTDEADAREMDGIHLTIGMLKSDPPEIAAMVAMDKVFFHYEPNQLAELDPTEDTAPAWWDRYVHNEVVKDDLRPAWASDTDWDKFMGRTKKYTVVNTQTGQRQPWTPSPANRAAPPATIVTPDADRYTRRPLTDEEEIAKLAEHGWYWSSKHQNFVHVSEMDDGEFVDKVMSEDLLPAGTRNPGEDGDTDAWVREAMTDYWEDSLGREFLDMLFDTGLLTDADTDAAIDEFPASTEKDYWDDVFRGKLVACIKYLRARGYTATVKLVPPQTPLPGQTEAFPQLEATTEPKGLAN